MKRILVILLIVVAGWANAQQTPVYSQYILHDYLINPAIVGTRDFYDAKFHHRNQWVGIDEAPRTTVLSANGPLKNRKMGIGGYYMNDRAGHIQQNGLYGTYSYIAQLEGVKLSFGLSVGIQSYTVDGTKLNLNESGDQVLSSGLQRSWVPDGTFGMMFYNDRLRVGFSINQLFGSSLTFFRDGNVATGNLTQHFNLHGSYLLGQEESDLNFVPYLLLKYVSPTPMQFDVGAQAIYKKNYWLGAAYRSDDAVSIMFGLLFRNNLSFGYSYDVITSDISARARTTHEIVLGIRFQRALPKKE